MKKFIVFIFMAFMMCVNANAEKVVGYYHQGSTEYNVEATTYKNDLTVFIQVMGEYKGSKVLVRIDGAENIQNFIDALNVCKAKYIEWSEVAKNNNITDFRKAINAEFPNVELWWFSSKWFSSHRQNYIKPEFLVSEGTSFVVIAGRAKYWDNEYITAKFYMFLTPENIDELVNALNVDAINSILNQEIETDTLFQ